MFILRLASAGRPPPDGRAWPDRWYRREPARAQVRAGRDGGPVYGSFATVAGMFALLYLVNQALVYAAEVAAVRYARLWPRALDPSRPTAADTRALALLAREQERIPAARIELRLVTRGSPPTADGSPPADDVPQ